MLDGVVVHRVLPDFCHVRDLRGDAHLPAFRLFTIDRSSHIEVLLDSDLRLRRVRCGGSLRYHCLVGVVRLLQVGSHAHLLLEIDLGQGVAFLAVFNLLVSFINQVIAGRDVVVPVVLYALLGVFPVKVELVQQFIKQLVLYRHLFFTWKETHISIPIFDLERPSVAPNVVH